MSITVAQADISNLAQELAGETSGRVNIFIAAATLQVAESQWGTAKANLAVIYLTCHMLTQANRGYKSGGAGGALTELKVSDVQQQFAPPSGTNGDAELQTTNYGIMFLQLRRTVVTGPLIV